MTERERVLWCAVKYAHAVDDNDSTAAVLTELTPRIPYLGDAALWEMRKAVRGYLDTARQYGAKHVEEWGKELVLVEDELKMRLKIREGEA